MNLPNQPTQIRYTREYLASLGVPWPPPKGWKRKLRKEGKLKERENTRAHKKSAKKIKFYRRKDRLQNPDLKPLKEDHQVYLTKGGKKYHSLWCACVNGVWLSGSNAIRVADFQEAMGLGLEICGICEKERIALEGN